MNMRNKNLDNACKIVNDPTLSDEQKTTGIISALGMRPKFTSFDEFDAFLSDPNSILTL